MKDGNEEWWGASIVIRYALTLMVIVFAYTETGIWTAVCLLLIGIGIEVNTILIRRISNQRMRE